MSDTNQRSQKLASAVYLITGFFTDQEPLKWQLRALSTDLVSNKVKDKYFVAKEILTLFTLAKQAGLVSDLNYEILLNELIKLQHEVEKPLELMFSRELTEPKPMVITRKIAEPIKDNNLLPSVEDVMVGTSESKKLKGFGAVSVKKNGRQSTIITILKRKKEIMIKDVSPLISGCSEKTIQRELSEMVTGGVLRRIGEKRWSRYTLA